MNIKINYNKKQQILSTICIIVPGILNARSDKGGGREDYIFQLSKKLSSHYKIVMLSPKNISSYDESINNNLTIKYINYPETRNYPPKTNIELFQSLISIYIFSILCVSNIIRLKKNGLRLIIVTDMISGFIPSLISKLIKIRIIIYEGNLTPWSYPWIFIKKFSILQKMFNAFLLILGYLFGKLSDEVVVNSNLIKCGMINIGINENKIQVIKGGVDIDSFTFSSPYLGNQINIGFIGRLEDEKGVPLLIKICEKSIEIIPNACFFIFGDGKYKSRLSKLPNVAYVGSVPHSLLNVKLSKIHVLMFFQKALGRAEYEALSCGKVIIACKLGEVDDIFKEGLNALLCDPNVDSYIDAVLKIIKNPLIINELSINARKNAYNFSYETVSQKWIVLINDILGSI